MSQDNILEKVRLYTEIPKKLPPLRSNSTRPQQRGLVSSTTNNNHINKFEMDQKRDSSGIKDSSQVFTNVNQSYEDSNQDLGVVLEQCKLQNKLNDQELQSLANRIQFIQNQQMSVWKKTNDLYDKAVYMYENKKRYQIENKMKEMMKQQKQKEIEFLYTKNEQQKDQNRQKIVSNQENFLINKKKQAQEIKEKSRELTQLRDYFLTTFSRAKKNKHEEIKQNYQKAQVKIQNFYDEKQKQYKEQYGQKIQQEYQVQEQKQQQIRDLEEVEKQLLDQFKKTKIQCDQLVNQLDEAQNLKPEEIEQKYPIFVSLASKNILDSNQYEAASIAQNLNQSTNNNISGLMIGQLRAQNSNSPLKKSAQINRNRQGSQNKAIPLQILQQQDHQELMNKTYFSRNFNQYNNNQYKSIQAKNSSGKKKDENGSSQQSTLQNSRYGYMYRSANQKLKQKKQILNYSAIYENESNSNKESTPVANKDSQMQEDRKIFDNTELNLHTFEIRDQLVSDQQNNYDYEIDNGISIKDNHDQNDPFNHSNDIMSSSPEKNSAKISLSNRGQQNKSPKRDKIIYSATKTSQTKIDLSMYQPRNPNSKKISIENSSQFQIATEGDNNFMNKRNRFNHFGDIMLNRDDITKQRKQMQSQQKQSRSKSFVTSNKLEVQSPYQSNCSNNNIKF